MLIAFVVVKSLANRLFFFFFFLSAVGVVDRERPKMGDFSAIFCVSFFGFYVSQTPHQWLQNRSSLDDESWHLFGRI